MPSYTAGSVTAKVELDTSDFDSKVKELKGKVDELKVTLARNGLADLGKQVKEMQEQLKQNANTIKDLTQRNKDYQKELAKLRSEVDNSAKSHKKNGEAVESESKKLSDYVKKTNDAVKSNEKLANSQKKVSSSAKVPVSDYDPTQHKRRLTETGEALKKVREQEKQLAQAKMSVREASVLEEAGFQVGKKILQEYLNIYAKAPVQVRRSSTEIENAIAKFAGFKTTGMSTELKQYLKTWAEAPIQVKRSSAEIEQALSKIITPVTSNAQYKQMFNELSTGFNKLTGQIIKATEVLNTFNFKLLEGVEKESLFYQKTMNLASSMQRLYNGIGRTKYSNSVLQGNNGGYSQYVAQISKVQESLTLLSNKTRVYTAEMEKHDNVVKRTSESIRMLAEQYLSLANREGYVNSASTNLNNRIKLLSNNIQSLSNKSSANAVSLTNESRAANNLGMRLTNLNNKFKQGKVSETEYRQGLKQLETELSALQTKFTATSQRIDKNNQSYAKANAEIKKLAEGYKQTATASNQMSTGASKASNSMTQTAHSGRILSNTLYQIRGALLSLKMIFTAMGGMALWGFATDIAEGVKDTFKAKNEMESQLAANSKFDSGGLAVFNKGLDDTVSKFKKINRYSIGETVSSIGMEFDLNAKQMADSMDIIAMIQSEYVRAGRTEEEAALAVKDILQGEFSRLSRETGVGKEELVGYGWDEDKTNIEGLMDALRKAAKDRHWDEFAKKATSLNDVLQITKSRFSEFGADFLQSITPLVTHGFNWLIDSIDGLSKSFNKLGEHEQATILGGGLLSGILAIGTALPMVTKGMGLAEIATLGWGKSLGTSVLNLNKNTVAQYGFRKALAEVITGTKASDLANVRSSKAIMGRLLGVKQSVLAEHGYATALVHSKGILKNHTGATNVAKISNMGLAQKIAYLTGNMKLQEAQGLKTSTAIRKIATSAKVLKIAFAGLMAVGIIAFYASISSAAKQTKKDIDAYHNVVNNGATIEEKAKESVESYTKSLEGLTKGTDEYKRTAANLDIAKGNLKDIQEANELAKQYDYNIKQYGKSIDDRKNARMVESLQNAGLKYDDATKKASGYADAVERGYRKELEAYKIEDKRLYSASQHINEQVDLMKEEGVSEKQRIKYVQEYSDVAASAAENWKRFYKGDLKAGAYAVLDEIRLVLIDIGNNTHVQKLMASLGETWKDWKPTLKSLAGSLKSVGEFLADVVSAFLENPIGSQIALWGGLGAIVGVAALKLGSFVTGSAGIIDFFKKVKDKAPSVIGWFKKIGKRAKDTGKEMEESGMSTKTNTPTTVPTDTKTWKKGEFWKTIGNDAKNTGRTMFKYMGYVAAGMVLAAEAIALLTLPMGAIALNGVVFEHIEPQVRAGVKGLEAIAPVVAIVLPPIIALAYVIDKMGGAVSVNLKSTLGKTAQVVATGMLLVAEAIGMLVAPMVAISVLGYVKGLLGDSVEQGKEAINVLADALTALVPIIPVFIVAVAMGAIAFSGVGALVEAGVIAVGMLLVSEAIVSLAEPMLAIAALGGIFPDLTAVQKGARTIEVAGEALKSLQSCMDSLTGIAWDNLSAWLATGGKDLGSVAEGLASEDGVITKLNKFATDFKEIKIIPIDVGKATQLSESATGLTTISNSLQDVKTAMDNIPDFDEQATSINDAYQQSVGGQSATMDSTQEGFFDKLKEPIEQLNTFISDFNNMTVTPVDGEKVSAISSSASAISTINTAIENVKTAMGNAVDTEWNANMSTGGLFGAVGGYLFGNGGASSSLKGGLDELYNSVADIMNFNERISGLTSEGSGDSSSIEGASNMVSALQTQINNLKTTLSGAIPTVKASAKGIGTAIVSGVKEGLSTLATDVSGIINSQCPSFEGHGKSLGNSIKKGFNESAKIKDTISEEMQRALTAMDEKAPEFYDKGKALGEQTAKGYKDGADIHSPGLMARSMFAELGYMDDALVDAQTTMYNHSYELGNQVATGFNPTLNANVSDFSQYQSGLNQVQTMANNTSVATGLAFNNMQNQANTSANNMATNVSNSYTSMEQNQAVSLNDMTMKNTTAYDQMIQKSNTSLLQMRDSTSKVTSQMTNAWKHMKNSIVSTANRLKSETSSHFTSLSANIGAFYRKIQNPSNWGAGSPVTVNHSRKPSTGRRISNGLKKRGAGYNPYKSDDNTMMTLRELKQRMGNSTIFKGYDLDKKVHVGSFLSMFDGGFGWGGWNSTHFNHIKSKSNEWSMKAPMILGKYQAGNGFKVKEFLSGTPNISFDTFQNTAEAIFSQIPYDFYFNSEKYGSWQNAMQAGEMNCSDGADALIALAQTMNPNWTVDKVHTNLRSGTGHFYAVINGKVMDTTNFQNHGSWSKLGAGSKPRKYGNSKSVSSDEGKPPITLNLTFNIDGKMDKDNAEEMGEIAGNKVVEMLSRSYATGL